MTLFQATLIAAFGYLSSIYSPWLTLGGWYTLGRPLIAGFVIDGDLPKRVLIRGVGPGLVPAVSAANVLANPSLSLFV